MTQCNKTAVAVIFVIFIPLLYYITTSYNVNTSLNKLLCIKPVVTEADVIRVTLD